MCLKRFLNVATEVAEWTDSGKSFQREGCKSEMHLYLGWPKGPTVLLLHVISVNGMGVMWQAWSEDK